MFSSQAEVIGEHLYTRWTLTEVKRCYPSLADAKSTHQGISKHALTWK